MIFLAILPLLFALNAAHASDYIDDNVEEVKKSDYANVVADIELFVVDEFNNKHKFLLHSEVLQLSKYFYFNFKLKDKNVMHVDKHVFHTASMAVFKKMLSFMYGAPVEFDTCEQFLVIILLQEHLEISDLNDRLIAVIGDNIDTFTPKCLMEILKIAHRSHTSFGEKCSEVILNYIASNHDIQLNCSRNELVGHLKGHHALVDEIDRSIANGKKEIPKFIKKASSPVYSLEIHEKALKIYYKHKDNKSPFSVSNSMADTEKVMEILKKQYNISTTFIGRKGVSNKYKIKVTP